MALKNCPECDKAISTAARTCPHCGCPLRNGSKPRSLLGPLLFGLIVVIILASMMDQTNKRSPAGLSNSPNAVHGPSCNATGADQLIAKAGSALIHRIDRRGSIPHIYVTPGWHELTIDEKRAFDGVLQCSLTRGAGDPIILSYHDYRTGKEIAESDSFGLRIH